mmetsp:Transcript_32231/g.63811  ORF Transcript_32231/g.63811 Transcript_32231/m.63811 type:complete len:205 (+) Transcript_32231:322-936(+)
MRGVLRPRAPAGNHAADRRAAGPGRRARAGAPRGRPPAGGMGARGRRPPGGARRGGAAAVRVLPVRVVRRSVLRRDGRVRRRRGRVGRGGRGAPLSVVLSRPAGRVSRSGRPPRPPRVEVPVLLPSGHARLLWVRALLRLLPRSKQCARPGEKRTKKSAWEEWDSNRNVFGGNSGGDTLSRWGCVLISQTGGSFHPLERSIERV